MKKLILTIFSAVLLSSLSFGQLVMDVIISNEVVNGGAVEFDIQFRQNAASSGPIYFHNGDMVVLFNTASFTNPTVEKLTGPPCFYFQHGFNNFISTNFTDVDNSQNCMTAFNVKQPYFDGQFPTSDFVGDGEAIINFNPINVDNASDHANKIAVIGTTPSTLGRFRITGHNGGAADLAVKFPAPPSPQADDGNGDGSLSPLVSSAFSLNPGTLQSDPVELANDPLPVELTKFEANKYNKNSSILRWQTASEQNSWYYVIERALEGTDDWDAIEKVDAVGQSNETQTYQYIDRDVFRGTVATETFLYRLRIVDQDDSFEYSNIESVRFGETLVGGGVKTFPNPAKDGLHIQIASDIAQKPTDVEVYDIVGKLVYVQQIAPDADYAYIEFGLAQIQSGSYMVQFSANGQMLTQEKIIVQR